MLGYSGNYDRISFSSRFRMVRRYIPVLNVGASLAAVIFRKSTELNTTKRASLGPLSGKIYAKLNVKVSIDYFPSMSARKQKGERNKRNTETDTVKTLTQNLEYIHRFLRSIRNRLPSMRSCPVLRSAHWG